MSPPFTQHPQDSAQAQAPDSSGWCCLGPAVLGEQRRPHTFPAKLCYDFVLVTDLVARSGLERWPWGRAGVAFWNGGLCVIFKERRRASLSWRGGAIAVGPECPVGLGFPACLHPYTPIPRLSLPPFLGWTLAKVRINLPFPAAQLPSSTPAFLPFGCRDESFYTLLRRPSDSDILP